MATGPGDSPSQGGHLKDPFDPRDHYYVPDVSTRPSKSVDLRQNEPQLVSTIYDQLQSNTCVANATAAALWYEEKAGRHAESWGVEGPSRLMIYWLARGAYKNQYLDISRPSDSGTFAREAMKAVAKCGVCAEPEWPFNVQQVNIRPPDGTFNKAAIHKIKYFYRLDYDRPEAESHQLTLEQKDKMGAILLDNLKSCLTEQYPVVFGFWYRLMPSLSFDETQQPFVLKDVWKSQSYPRHVFQADLPDKFRARDKSGIIVTLGGHTVLAIGYDDDRQQVLVQNSRGPAWGGSGTFWMPYSWITDCAGTNDFWTIRPEEITAATRWEDVRKDVIGA